ncbi:hypothetical protein PMAYCL1PPCAC_07533, partial [Pristionchus mayeri]
LLGLVGGARLRRGGTSKWAGRDSLTYPSLLTSVQPLSSRTSSTFGRRSASWQVRWVARRLKRVRVQAREGQLRGRGPVQLQGLPASLPASETRARRPCRRHRCSCQRQRRRRGRRRTYRPLQRDE